MKTVNFNHKGMGVQCLFHTSCNLNCKFCFETKEKGIREHCNIDVNYIKQLPDELVSSISPIMNDNGIKAFSLYMMGGELFYDNISDEVFNAYVEFARTVKSRFMNEFGIRCVFNVVSNGVFTKRERVEKFLREFDIRLILSYDPLDRFSNDNQKDIWYETFKYFHDRSFDLAISILLTKRNINAYIAGDEIFEKIPSNIFIDSNIYVPRLDYHDYLPNDNDLFNFYKWALDSEKFNISDVNSILKHSHICQQEFYYAFGREAGMNCVSNCLEGLPFSKEEYYGKLSEQIVDDTNCLKYKQPLGIQKRGCLMCEYYMECSEMCWTQILFDKYELSECPIKRIYQYIDNIPEVLSRFNKWRELYEEQWRQKPINE